MDESAKRDAYNKGLKLKSTGLDEETILIRLEKQGVPYDLAKEVAKNVCLQRRVDALDNPKTKNILNVKGFLISHLIKEIQFWFETRKKKKENKE